MHLAYRSAAHASCSTSIEEVGLERRAAQILSTFLRGERAAIRRRWRRELHARALEPPDLATRLEPLLDELPAILDESESPALVLSERLAGRGAERYRQQARLRDVEREIAVLHTALIGVWGNKRGELPVDVALLVAELIDEAVLRVSRDYARQSESAETQLRLSSVTRALSQLSEVVLVLDRRGVIVLATGPVEALLGRTPQELHGQPGRGPALQALRKVEAVAAEQVRVRHAHTGEERTCETRAYPLLEGGQPVGAIEILRDVTLELLREEELRRADRELTSLHARLLRRGHGQAMAELATTSASALNNELNAISMSLSLLHKELPAAEERVARHLSSVELAVQRAAGLLARLQQLAARQPNAAPRAVSLNELLMEALELVRPELTTSSTRKAVRVDAQLGEVRAVLAQPSELRELVCSLMIEARESMVQGGGLAATTRPERDGASLILAYPLGAPLLGDPFATTTDRGITLAAARDRARRWGGDLEAEARAGLLTLRLILPAAPSARAAPSAARPVPQPARHILVVDDDAGNRETLTELLILSGHEVRAAASGALALAAMADSERPFDVALIDLAMPDMNGIELAHQLRAQDPLLRMALVTGWEPSAVDSHDEDGLIEAIFRKPIDLPAINRFLDGSSPSDQPQPTTNH